jgi:hypothetical protein
MNFGSSHKLGTGEYARVSEPLEQEIQGASAERPGMSVKSLGAKAQGLKSPASSTHRRITLEVSRGA